MRRNLRTIIGCFLAPALLSACDKPRKTDSSQTGGPQTQQAAPATSPAVAASQNGTQAPPKPAPEPAPPAVDPATLREPGPFTWKLPAGWTEKPNTQPMRYATLAAADSSDVSISAFPGTAGGNLANINRWRAQVGMMPLERIDDSVIRETRGGRQMFLLDLNGPQGQRILGAIVSDKNRTWFFKMQGASEAIGKNKDAFLELVRSLNWREGA
jgi:hypothetical protein